MNRLKKKCFFGVTLLHALPLLVAVIGTAFFNKPEPVEERPRIIELVDFTVTDGPTRGGSPAASAAPAPAPEPVRLPDPVPPRPVPQPQREPEPEPELPKPIAEPPKATVVEKEIESEKPEVKTQPKTPPKTVSTPKTTVKTTTPKPRRNIDVSKPQTINPRDRQAANDAAAKAAEERERNARAAAVTSSLSRIGKGLSGSTTIELPGGTGGAAEINYGDLVLHKYDVAWIAPLEVDDDVAIAKARVVIGRNGNVISSKIIKGSGNAVLDKSVQRALDSVRSIAPFPAGSTDSQRTYIINFNLKSKRGIG